MEDIQEKLRDIKAQFRAAMNGVASAQMRQGGLNYRVNFGIELPRLREIACDYQPQHELAQALWNENVRESKILAGILMPVERFYPEVADIWVEQIPNQEIAELTVMNLFVRLPYASQSAFRWIAQSQEIVQVCGFLLLTRLCMKGCQFNEQAANELVDQAVAALQDSNLRVAQQAFILLRKFVLLGSSERKAVQQAIGLIQASEGSRLEGWCTALRMDCNLPATF